jgi:hypothetical protein
MRVTQTLLYSIRDMDACPCLRAGCSIRAHQVMLRKAFMKKHRDKIRVWRIMVSELPNSRILQRMVIAVIRTPR